MDLLGGIQKLRKLVMGTSVSADLRTIVQSLSQFLSSNVWMINETAHVLDSSIVVPRDPGWVLACQAGRIDGWAKPWLRLDETTTNVRAADIGIALSKTMDETDWWYTFLPVATGWERHGALVLGREFSPFREDELVLGEYCASILGLEILHVKYLGAVDDERLKTLAHLAIHAMSFSEAQAAKYLLEAVKRTTDGVVVSGRIADAHGVSRAVMVNCLRKFQSAGVIESRSLGTKGTYVRVLNRYVEDEVRRVVME